MNYLAKANAAMRQGNRHSHEGFQVIAAHDYQEAVALSNLAVAEQLNLQNLYNQLKVVEKSLADLRTIPLGDIHKPLLTQQLYLQTRIVELLDLPTEAEMHAYLVEKNGEPNA